MLLYKILRTTTDIKVQTLSICQVVVKFSSFCPSKLTGARNIPCTSRAFHCTDRLESVLCAPYNWETADLCPALSDRYCRLAALVIH